MSKLNVLLKYNRCSNIIKQPALFRRLNSSKPGKNEEINTPRRIFSGIQPTGALHIGNYFGAVKSWIDLQNKGDDVMVSIVDLHSITLPQNPETLQNNILEITATLLACGIDHNKSILFLQSSVPQHSELAWILGCISTMARLAHLPQFKEKSESMKEVPLGLYIYPVLQGADILLYKSTHVPVGIDQIQHLQVAQQLAKTFNYRFGKTFPSPIPMIGDDCHQKLRSLRDPTKKMSKSDPDPKSRIELTDGPDLVALKLKKSVTDFTPTITYDPVNRPGVSNLVTIMSLMTNQIPEEVCEEAEGFDTVMFKNSLAKAIGEVLAPIQTKIEDYMKHPEYLVTVLQEGSLKARERASVTMEEVNMKVGLGVPNMIKKEYHKSLVQ
ncbi:tryptophanyl-tRNA synthetase, mitochondrial [Arctopsyche grandis]|uniref:tryptophanyl-tRNA synthetase, mitochondrial n=1 Tax=Arctopsyche grandis TaxID=121162 RepID=UPI00406D8D35